MKKPISKTQKRNAITLLLAALITWALAVVSSIPEPAADGQHFIVVIDGRRDNGNR